MSIIKYIKRMHKIYKAKKAVGEMLKEKVVGVKNYGGLFIVNDITDRTDINNKLKKIQDFVGKEFEVATNLLDENGNTLFIR